MAYYNWLVLKLYMFHSLVFHLALGWSINLLLSFWLLKLIITFYLILWRNSSQWYYLGLSSSLLVTSFPTTYDCYQKATFDLLFISFLHFLYRQTTTHVEGIGYFHKILLKSACKKYMVKEINYYYSIILFNYLLLWFL